MSLSEPATFWGKYVKVVSGVQLILFWSYSRFGSIVLSWTYHGLSNLATLLAHWITTKNTSQIASNCRNQHQPTHTHIYIYIHELLEICFATTSIRFFPPKSEQNIAVVFRFPPSARAMEFQMSHTQKGRRDATTNGTLLLEVGKSTIFCWVPLW
jgi:hypothetical protein